MEEVPVYFLHDLVVLHDIQCNPLVLKFKLLFPLLNMKANTERRKKFLEFLSNALGHSYYFFFCVIFFVLESRDFMNSG